MAARRSSRSTAGGIKRRISRLETELDELGRTRRLQRQQRDRSGLAAVTIVGYTNAGKSTLLNTLTDAGVLTEDRLFATLDPTTRRLALPGGEPVLLTDTVGFVRRLPHGLVESFKSHARGGHARRLPRPRRRRQRRRPARARSTPSARCSPRSTPTDVPELLVFNKADLAPDEAKRLVDDHPGSVAVSAVDGRGHRRLPAHARRPAALDHRRSSSSRCPTTAATCWPRSTARARSCRRPTSRADLRVRARLSDASAGRLAEFVVGAEAP